jgi:phage/plasmid-associated DNA primase
METQQAFLSEIGNTSPSGPFTHLTYHSPRGRWLVPNTNMRAFWSGYCQMIAEHPEQTFCIAERPIEEPPVIVDFTFRFHKQGEAWEPYDDLFLYSIVHCYQTAIAENFQISEEDNFELLCCVLESGRLWEERLPASTGNQDTCSVTRIRIQFPYCHMSVALQKKLRIKAVQMFRTSNIISKLDFQPIGDWEKIIDTHTMDEPISLYGSDAVMGRPRLSLTHIWTYIPIEATTGEIDVVALTPDVAFVPMNHGHVAQGLIGVDMFEGGIPEHWVAMLLSVHYWPKVLAVRQGNMIENQQRTPSTPSESRMFGLATQTQEETTIESAEKFLEMVKPHRFLDEASWMDIGRALYHTHVGDETGLLSWMRATQLFLNEYEGQLPRHLTNLEERCRLAYELFSSTFITIKTLAWFAKEDNLLAYNEWHRNWSQFVMQQAIECTHAKVAKAFYRVYWLDFACATISKNAWFQFRNNRWMPVDCGYTVRTMMSDDFVKRFEGIRYELTRQKLDARDEGLRTILEATMKKLGQLINKLDNRGFKNSVASEAMDLFKHERFSELLDMNPETMGVLNGVLEAVGNKVVFRKGKPEDYISKCTNIPYRELSWDHHLVKECREWFEKVFPDEQLRDYFYKFSASIIKGRNSDKLFPVWTGEGNNSKSMVVKLYEAVFGPYCIKFPISLVAGRVMKSTSNATPELARARTAKVAFLQEPDDDEGIRKGDIKAYTGGDSFFARMLHDNGGDVVALFKLILMCNRIPMVNNPDKAYKERFRAILFPSRWSDEAPSDPAEQKRLHHFKKDPHFEKRIPSLASSFLWIIVNYYTKYIDEGLADPAIIKEYTNEYWRENDVYSQFTAECVEEARDISGGRDMTAKLNISELYHEFKDWFKDAFHGTKIPERAILKLELTNRWGRPHGITWFGVRIRGKDQSYNNMLSSKQKPTHQFELVPGQSGAPQRVIAPPTPGRLTLVNVADGNPVGFNVVEEAAASLGYGANLNNKGKMEMPTMPIVPSIYGGSPRRVGTIPFSPPPGAMMIPISHLNV